jgi:hypothetical protein
MTPSCQLEDSEDAITSVSELIDSDNGTWKIDLVRRNFIAPEADAILNMPLRRDGGDDFWAWDLERTGVYTVKSAYRSLMTQNDHSTQAEGTMTGTSTSEKQMWDRLWKMQVVPKVRVFWWRVLRGILPVEATLQHRHIAQLARCKVCLACNEDTMHALVKCSHAQRFWTEARSSLNIKLPQLHPITWTRDLVCGPQFGDSDRAKIITVMWAIWTSRNNIVHDKNSIDPVHSMKMTRDALSLLDLPR